MKIHTVHISKKAASIILLGVFLIVCTIFVLLCIAGGRVVSTAIANGKNAEGCCFIIDAGHGGEDGGAVAQNGVMEKEINLKIALILNDLLKAAGHKTVMVRATDTDLSDPLGTVRERKNSDLHNRKELIYNTPNAVLISIHQNYFEQPQYSGTQVFYSPNNPSSELLAEKIRLAVIGGLQPENKRELKSSNGNIFLLREAQCPAVLVECGFLSNSQEAEKLCNESYQKQMAFAVYQGIENYLNG